MSSPRLALCAAAIALPATPAVAGGFPPGFTPIEVAGGFERPVGMAFAGDGRIFVAEQRGMVWVVEDGVVLAQPFIDLRDEVNGPWDRGLLGIALHSGFLANRRVYLLYTVDPVHGEPDEPPQDGAFSRLTRYTGTAASGGNVADPASRLVLIGATPPEGIPVCEPSHTIGSVRFALDGTLFVSAGDGAHFDAVDDGGLDPDCFVPGMFPEAEDVGAFRSQYLASLAGKLLRVDAETGLGLPTNPHWTGDASDNASRVWASGLRNPYRIAVRPGSPMPGTVYVGDVGWNEYEEINVAKGAAENFGWPCREGPNATPGYGGAEPAHSGCETLETPENPGPLTGPLVSWHHFNPNVSDPPGYTGRTALAGAFTDNACYPAPFDDAFFFLDYATGWIKALEVDANDAMIGFHDFADVSWPTDLAVDPVGGDLHYLELFSGELHRIGFDADVPGDVDGDCVVGIADLLALLAAWGPCPGDPDPCDADLDGDDAVGIGDLLMLLANWSP